MPYIPPEVVAKAREMDLLTYLRTYEPQELVHFGGSTYCTREHDSLKISNGKWCWFSRGIGGYSALDYLIMVDIMVRAEDASKINRIVERFKLATVDAVSIKRDIAQSKADKAAPSAPEQEKPDKAADDRLLDDLLGAPVQKEKHAFPNPAAAKTEKFRPSAPTSEKQSRTAEGTAKSPEERPSVREELREIRESRQKETAEPSISEPTLSKEPKKQPTTTHKQPSRKKPKKAKER